jgi:hypothetical protein
MPYPFHSIFKSSIVLRSKCCYSDRVLCLIIINKGQRKLILFSSNRCLDFSLGFLSCSQNSDEGWRYIYPSYNELKCAEYGVGCRTSQYATTGLMVSTYSVSGNISQSDIIEYCSDLNQTVAPIFEWIKPFWENGKHVTPKIIQKEMILANQLAQTLNFTKIQYYVSLPSQIYLLSLFQNLVCITNFDFFFF